MRRMLRALFRQRGPITWVVYDHPVRPPLMYPDLFVAQKRIGSTPTSDVVTSGSHRELLLKLPPDAKRRDRRPSDDPGVIEVWLQ